MFDGVEVGGIRRQEQKRCTGLFDQLQSFRRFVEGRVVHDDKVIVVQARAELPLQPPVEDVCVACSFKQKRFFKALSDTGGDQ